jgi:regulator of cell morphogenesis and NO signaling
VPAPDDPRGPFVDHRRDRVILAEGGAVTPAATHHTLSESELHEASLGELCDHIVSEHHTMLRSELPRIDKLAAKIAEHHGSERPSLVELRRAIAELREELLEHLDSEEMRLFPFCRAIDDGDPGSLPSPTTRTLAMHRKAHEKVYDKLAAMRELGEGYVPGRALCNGHRSLLESLDALERDLRQHIHEENDVLFPQLHGFCASVEPAVTA